jgi:spore coat protein CotH
MENNWSKYLDVNSFLRHFLVGELSGNTDTYWSVFMYKERDESLMHVGPVWDFDLAFHNDQRIYPVNTKSDYIYRSGGSCAGNMRNFVDNIVINNAASKRQLLEIWDGARQSGLTEAYMLAYIDRWAAELEQSQRLNFLRWPILNQKVHQNVVAKGSFQAEVEVVRTFMKERIAWMDKKLGYTYKPSGISELRFDETLPYQVFSLSGQPYGNSVDNLSPGIYVVRQGTVAKKIVVK